MPKILDAIPLKEPIQYESQAPGGSMDTDSGWMDLSGVPPFNELIKYEGDASVDVGDGIRAVRLVFSEPRSFAYTSMTMQLLWHLLDSDLRIEFQDGVGTSRIDVPQAGPVPLDVWHQRSFLIADLESPGTPANIRKITQIRMTAVNYTPPLTGKYMLIDDWRCQLQRGGSFVELKGGLR